MRASREFSKRGLICGSWPDLKYSSHGLGWPFPPSASASVFHRCFFRKGFSLGNRCLKRKLTQFSAFNSRKLSFRMLTLFFCTRLPPPNPHLKPPGRCPISASHFSEKVASHPSGKNHCGLVARAIRNAIRANHSQFIVRQADSHESLEFPIRANHPLVRQADSHESLEFPIRANHATKHCGHFHSSAPQPPRSVNGQPWSWVGPKHQNLLFWDLSLFLKFRLKSPNLVDFGSWKCLLYWVRKRDLGSF